MKMEYEKYERIEKALRWLSRQFRVVEQPKDDADKLASCISRYSAAGADAIIELVERQMWSDAVDEPPEEEDVEVLVIASGMPHPNIILKEAYQLAFYSREDGWILSEYPEWEDPEVKLWMPLPKVRREYRRTDL